MSTSSKYLLIIIVAILALVSAFVLGRIDFGRESNMANSFQSSTNSSSLLSSVVSSNAVENNSLSIISISKAN